VLHLEEAIDLEDDVLACRCTSSLFSFGFGYYCREGHGVATIVVDFNNITCIYFLSSIELF
jgi:hypothetical protein